MYLCMITEFISGIKVYLLAMLVSKSLKYIKHVRKNLQNQEIYQLCLRIGTRIR